MKYIGSLLALFAFCYMLGLLVAGCTPRAAKEAAADSAYMAEHLACVDEHDTHEAADACRDEVRRRWGVDGGAR